jgi:glycosyltransferase involved in cell wall biosynthesis
VNIVILNDAAFIRGGADRVAFDSARGLARRGHRVLLFTAFGPVAPEVRALGGVSVTCLGSPWLRNERGPGAALSGIWNLSAARALRAVLSGLDPADTVVHTHLYASSLSGSVMNEALSAGFPTLLTLHDYFITCPNGAYFVFPRSEACGRNALSLSCLACNCDSRRRSHKAWRIARTWVQGRVARLPGRITAYAAVSGACAALARRDLPSTARVEIVPNIVAVERGEPVPVARNRAYLFTGRFEAYKGPQLLAAAASRLGVPAVFCGSGPMEPELRRLCPGATFTGWLPPGGVQEELGRARAFVFPSVYRETFGLSAAEALARGIPVVASRGTAAEEFVSHGENGLLFEHNSAEDLGRQLALLGDDALVRRLGAEAHRRYWQAPLTELAHVERLEELYASVTRRGSQVPAAAGGARVRP